jgi:protein-S-isoprenylcysteine O-methyltransferase Ste14
VNTVRYFRAFFQRVALPAWWCICLFGSAGQLMWKRGWICTVLYLGALYTTKAILRRRNPVLLEHRETAIRTDTQPFDKIVLRVILSLTIVQPVVAGLDAVRFRWAPMPLWTVFPGIGLFALSATWITCVLVNNPHAESSVRIQKDRDHSVIASGPYRFVRHPMYVGLILLHASMALMLGSMWTLVLAAMISIVFLFRTSMEDRVLRQKLPGYEEYTAVTRYRLLPGIW